MKMGFGLLHWPLPALSIKEYFCLNTHQRNQKQSLFQQRNHYETLYFYHIINKHL